MNAGYCADCATNVWLSDDGSCVNGHPASSISGVYETQPAGPPASPSIRKEVPRWAAVLWGVVLLGLNIFMVLYLLVFVSAFASFGTATESSWAMDLIFNQQPFGLLFAVVGAAVILSFVFIALSFAHVFAWSGLELERKLLLAAIIFAGGSPGLLVYWYLNVWRREGARIKRAEPADTPSRRALLSLLGIVTLRPIAYFVFFFATVAIGVGGGEAGPLLNYLPALHISIIVLWWLLTAVYLIDSFRNPRLSGMLQVGWAFAVAMGGPVAWPVYWYMNLWRRPSDPVAATH